MQADRISERDHWLTRTREAGQLLVEQWDRMEIFVRRARGTDVQAELQCAWRNSKRSSGYH